MKTLLQKPVNVATVINETGDCPVVLVCEHASQFIPESLAALGLDQAALDSHIAWDIGALNLAKSLSQLLNAPLIAASISRLVYDCNRPLSAADCIPEESESYRIPGNVDIDETERHTRFEQIHTPFHESVASIITQQRRRFPTLTIITIHSFTPVYFGKTRTIDIGLIHASQPRLARAMLATERYRNRYRAALNEPYSGSDGVTYTLRQHADNNDLDSVMIEVRNDLINTPEKADLMAQHLNRTIRHAIEQTSGLIIKEIDDA